MTTSLSICLTHNDSWDLGEHKKISVACDFFTAKNPPLRHGDHS